MPARTRSKPIPKGDVTDELDIEIVKLLETQPALTNVAIGEKLGMEKETVAKRRARPAFRRLYGERNLPAREILQAYRATAAKVYVGLLANTTPHATRERAARGVLGIELDPPPLQNQQGPIGLLLPPDAVDAIRRYYAPGGGAPVPQRRRRRAA